MIVPIPGGATDVSGMSVVEIGAEASSVLEVVSLVAGEAVSGTVGGSALIGNGYTDSVGVGEPSLRAGKTILIVPIPGSASRVGGLGIVGGREDASSVLEVVALEAGKAVSAGIMRSALIGDGGANLVGVEDPSVGA